MARNRDNKQREASEFEERVVFINRVSKTVKGGRRMSLVALVVVGDGKGNVGLGMGKSAEVPLAISKASLDAKKHMFHVPVTETGTIPHEVEGPLWRWQDHHQARYRGYRRDRRRRCAPPSSSSPASRTSSPSRSAPTTASTSSRPLPRA